MATSFLCESGLGRDSVSGYSRLVTDTIAYIRDNLSSQLRLDNLASISFVSKSQLRNKFRSETGITLGRYIDEQLILEAQRRLCQTEDAISKISFDLGFCDQFYFSNRFSRRCGIAPQVYRKRTRQLVTENAEPLIR